MLIECFQILTVRSLSVKNNELHVEDGHSDGETRFSNAQKFGNDSKQRKFDSIRTILNDVYLLVGNVTGQKTVFIVITPRVKIRKIFRPHLHGFWRNTPTETFSLSLWK